MKKILIALLLFTNVCFAQLPCSVANGTVSTSSRFMMCDGSTGSKYARLFQIIDTTKEYYIAQGRGSTPFLLYFNGTAWVRNDTSYIPRSGASNITGNLTSSSNSWQLGLSSNYNKIDFYDTTYTDIISYRPSTGILSEIQPYSGGSGSVSLLVNNVLNTSFTKGFFVEGSLTASPIPSFKFYKGLAYYDGDYRSEMTTDVVIPDIGKVKQLISDSIGTVQSTTLADGKIWIGDGTNTAFPRTLSGDVTVSNLGVTTISNNAVTNAKILDETINLSTKVTNRLDTANMVLVGQNQSYFGGKYYALKDSITNTSPSVRNMIDSDLPSRSRNKFKLFGNMNVYGTSIEVGASAESGTTTEGGYLYLIANNLGLKLNNYASGGNGIYVSAISAFTTIPTLDNYSSLYIGGQLNDARKGTDRVNVNPAISKKIVAGYNSIMASHFARLQVPVSSGSITKGGSWSNFTTITTRSSGALSGNAMFATSSGATLTYTSPVTSNLIIGCFGTDGVIKSYGRFTISVDGVVVATYVSNGVADGRADFAGNDNSIIPDAVVIQNLQNKAHTVVITTLDNLTTPVDYIGTLNYPNSCQPVILSSIMKLTDIGYAKATSEIPPKNFGSDRIFNQIDSAIQQNINSDSWYNYPITFWNCNIDFNPYTGTSTDSIHPTYSVGYPALAKGFLKNAIQPSADVKNQQLYTNTAGTATNFFGWSSDDNFSFNLNRQLGTAIAPNTSRPQAAIIGAIASGASNWSFHTSPANNSGVTEAMRIDGSQNVGIGTSSPTVKLQVSADIMMGNKYIISDDYTSTTALINNTSGEAHSLRILTKDKDGTDNVQLTLEAVGDPLAANREFFAFAYNAGSQDYQLFTTATGTGTIRPFRMGVGTDPTAIYVNASSNVGFGTTTPQSKVDIEGGVAVGSTYAGTTAAPTNGAIIEGNVGIGTSAPDVPLVVSTAAVATFTGVARFLAPNNTTSGNASSLTIGVATTTNNAAQLRFHYNGSASTANRLDFGFSGNSNAVLSVLASGTVLIQSFTVATLPTCAAGVYQRATVTDALAPAYDVTVVGGGARVIEVICNGTNWVCH